MKFIVVTGGVMSGLGKGITASTTGLLLKNMGLTVTVVKIDPYLNVDAGTMSPYEHGECYVLDDGSEVDLDLGNYERFLGITLTGKSSITTGKVYQKVITKERAGEYLGKTVQIVPHLTNEIISMLEEVCHDKIDGKVPDVCIIEMGGTIGDIEGLPFIEALRQMVNLHDMCFIHLSMLVQSGNELKTKPTQTSLKELNRNGIFPNILCIRTPVEFSDDIRKKLSMFCQVSQDMIICNTNVKSIYDVPILFSSQFLGEKVCMVLKLLPIESAKLLDTYNYISSRVPIKTVRCIIVGKYTESNDTYLSIIRALEHASISINIHVDVVYIAGEDVDNNSITLEELLTPDDVVIIPGGFGTRGTNGMLKTIEHCRLNNISILGICFGFQLMVIQLCRNIGLLNADSEEILPKEYLTNVVHMVDTDSTEMGGTMRLGSHLCNITPGSMVHSLYKTDTIMERHRHRYEVDRDKIKRTLEYSYQKLDVDNIVKFVSTSIHKNHTIYEILEIKDHKFFVGCQFHPEFLSRLEKPHPLFVGLLNR